MAALAPVAPRTLKAMLEADRYSVKHEDDDNWIMDRGPDDEILCVPKSGDTIALDAMYSLLEKAKISDRKYFDLLALVS